jgi:hypothetical protein
VDGGGGKGEWEVLMVGFDEVCKVENESESKNLDNKLKKKGNDSNNILRISFSITKAILSS